MKTRQGFVSNSSSASFVIVWEWNLFNDHATDRGSPVFNEEPYDGEDPQKREAKQAIARLLDSWDDKDVRARIDRIASNTRVLKENLFETTFWTAMLNDPSNFGEDCAQFCLCLMVSGAWHRGSPFEVKSTRVIKD